MRGTITFFIDRSAHGDRRFIRNQLRIALRSRASVNQTSSEIFGLFRGRTQLPSGSSTSLDSLDR